MANNRVARNSFGATSYTAGASGLAVDSDTDLLMINVDGTQRGISTSDIQVLTTSKTATGAESGTVFIADSTSSIVVTLPPTVRGLKYTLIVKQLTTSGGHAFSPNAADQIIGNGFTPADDKDAICTAASDAVGDTFELTGDGSAGWYVTRSVGTWDREV